MTWRSDGWSRRSPSWSTAGPLARRSASRSARCSTRGRRSSGPACAPTMQASILCAVRYEGWAPDDAAARDLVAPRRGAHRAVPRHGRRRADDRASSRASMPVFVVENRAHGNRASAHHQRGPGQGAALRRQRRPVIERLRWLARRARARSSARPSRDRRHRPPGRSCARRSAWATRCTSAMSPPRRSSAAS